MASVSSRLFVKIDDFAYVAFTKHESTLATPACKSGATFPARAVSVAREEEVVLWQIHADGTYRSTIVEKSKGASPLSSPVTVSSPTGAIIPDGLGGVLLSIRKASAATVGDVRNSNVEFVYRLNADGDVVYAMLLPKYVGKLHDEMSKMEKNSGAGTHHTT